MRFPSVLCRPLERPGTAQLSLDQQHFWKRSRKCFKWLGKIRVVREMQLCGFVFFAQKWRPWHLVGSCTVVLSRNSLRIFDFDSRSSLKPGGLFLRRVHKDQPKSDCLFTTCRHIQTMPMCIYGMSFPRSGRMKNRPSRSYAFLCFFRTWELGAEHSVI